MVIREASMHEGSWEMTLLDRCHDAIASKVSLYDDEYPLVSFFASDGDWNLYTTHRLVGETSGTQTEIECSDFDSTAFGNFKRDLDSPRVTEAVVRSKHGSRVFLYESGYASMAPIHYFKFWSLKWPAWKETYRIENEESERDEDGDAKEGICLKSTLPRSAISMTLSPDGGRSGP